MSLVPRLSWVVALVALPIIGCNEVIEEEPRTAPVTMSIQNADVSPQTALEGARVCETDNNSNCDVSGADGEVTIWLPVNQEISYTIQKEGFDSMLISAVVPEIGARVFWGMNTVGFMAELYGSVESPYPRLGTGEIFIGLAPRFAGATFNLDGATGKAYYLVGRGPDASISVDLTATTEDGAGGFIEVPPGTFRVELGGTANGCVPTFGGWPGDVENSVRVRVLADHASFVVLSCPLP